MNTNKVISKISFLCMKESKNQKIKSKIPKMAQSKRLSTVTIIFYSEKEATKTMNYTMTKKIKSTTINISKIKLKIMIFSTIN